MKNTNHPTRWWDFPSALLLFVAMMLASLRLHATNWTDDLTSVQLVTLLGTLTGLASGYSRFHQRMTALMGSLFGGVTIAWQLGRIFTESSLLWSVRLAVLGRRLGIALNNLLQDRAVTDPVLFLFMMMFLFWVLSHHAGYSLMRNANLWQAITPMGIALFIIHIHDPYWPSRAWYLAGFIFLALLLLARLTYLQRRAQWLERHTHIPPFVGLDFLRVTLLTGGVVIILAWTVPALAANVPPIRQAWQRFAQPYYRARQEMSNAFASLRGSVGLVRDYYGETLPLGRGNELTDTVVMTIQAPARPTASIRYYWRARVYNHYEAGQWRNTKSSTRKFAPEDTQLDALTTFTRGRWEASFIVFPGVPLSTLYIAPQPQWINLPVNAEFALNPDGSLDYQAFQAVSPILPGESYQFRSALTNVTIAQLRAAGSSYPDWVVERYLQLPDHITARTIALAQQIAEGLDTPYDIANAVTEYLRENIQYSDTVPTPPPNQDVIDWILFDLQQGFCNYYATAEVVLLRSLGIPARMAVGYAQGERDLNSGTYTVRQRDAHAWPEVYFPGIGWVEFEPTLNQRPLRRPLGEDSAPDSISAAPPQDTSRLPEDVQIDQESGEGGLAENSGAAEGSPRWLILLRLSALLLISLALILGAIRYSQTHPSPKEESKLRRLTLALPLKIEQGLRRAGLQPPPRLRQWAYLARLPAQARAYQEINHALKRLGSPPAPHHTPAERAHQLSRLLPPATDFIYTLLNEYHNLTYGNHPEKPSPAWHAAYALRDLSRRERLRRLLKRISPTS